MYGLVCGLVSSRKGRPIHPEEGNLLSGSLISPGEALTRRSLTVSFFRRVFDRSLCVWHRLWPCFPRASHSPGGGIIYCPTALLQYSGLGNVWMLHSCACCHMHIGEVEQFVIRPFVASLQRTLIIQECLFFRSLILFLSFSDFEDRYWSRPSCSCIEVKPVSLLYHHAVCGLTSSYI